MSTDTDKRQKRVRRLLVNLTLAVTSFLIGCLIAEVIARIVLPMPNFRTMYFSYLPFERVEFHNHLRGIPAVAVKTTNAWGFQGDPPPHDWNNTYTIITIGGSTTYGSFLDTAQTWPALLQNDLHADGNNVWINNAGLDGHTSRAHVIVMDTVIREVRPKAVIVLAGANDLAMSLSVNGRKTGTVVWDDLLTRNDASFYAFFTNFRIYILFQALRIRLTNPNQWTDLGSLDQQISGYFTPISASDLSPLPDDLSQALPTLPTYRQNLERIVDIAQSLKVQVLFLTQPTLMDDTPDWAKTKGGFWWVTDPALTVSGATTSKMLGLYNQAMLDVCQERHVACYDLASKIPHDEQYFFDQVHYTTAGSQLVAQEVKKAVEQLLLPPAA